MIGLRAKDSSVGYRKYAVLSITAPTPSSGLPHHQSLGHSQLRAYGQTTLSAVNGVTLAPGQNSRDLVHWASKQVITGEANHFRLHLSGHRLDQTEAADRRIDNGCFSMSTQSRALNLPAATGRVWSTLTALAFSRSASEIAIPPPW